MATEKAFSQTDQVDTASSKTNEPAPYVTGLTAGRARSLVGVAAGLMSLIIGRWAKRRSAVNPGSGRSWNITALVLGVVAIVLSVVHLANITGGFGTGAGKAGAIVALVLGLVGTTLSGFPPHSKRK